MADDYGININISSQKPTGQHESSLWQFFQLSFLATGNYSIWQWERWKPEAFFPMFKMLTLQNKSVKLSCNMKSDRNYP